MKTLSCPECLQVMLEMNSDIEIKGTIRCQCNCYTITLYRHKTTQEFAVYNIGYHVCMVYIFHIDKYMQVHIKDITDGWKTMPYETDLSKIKETAAKMIKMSNF